MHAIIQLSMIECEAGLLLRFAEELFNPGGDRPDRMVKRARTHQVVSDPQRMHS